MLQFQFATKGSAPRYTHTCPKCKLLAQSIVNGHPTDWYRCYGSDPSIIGRFGEDSMYWSMPVECVTYPRDSSSTNTNLAKAVLALSEIT